MQRVKISIGWRLQFEFSTKYFPKLSDLEESWRSFLAAAIKDIPQLKCTPLVGAREGAFVIARNEAIPAGVVTYNAYLNI
jgi:hypothetical protein